MSSPGNNGLWIQAIIHSTSRGFVQPSAPGFIVMISECRMPHQLRGSATASPASGPLMAMSNSDLRSATPGCWKITAPIVPKGPIGIGMNSGRLAGTR